MIDNDMFAQIKGALQKSSGGNSNSKFREILKLEPGNVYTVRFVPNMEDPSKTFFHYFAHAWESFSTGQYLSHISPQTWGEKDPIAEARFSLSKHGTDDEKAKASKVIRRENWLANIYVVNDPTKPENNGKVKLLRFGKQIHKIVMDAIEGDDADEFGMKIFDLGDKGCNFKIKAERQGDFPTYVSSRFASPSKIDGLDAAAVQTALESTHDLESVYKVKSYDELKGVLDEHFYCRDTSSPSPQPAGNDLGRSSTEPAENKQPKAESNLDDVDPLDDDKVKQLLEGLDG